MKKKAVNIESRRLWLTALVVYIFCLGTGMLIHGWVEKAERINPLNVFFRDFNITDLYYHPNKKPAGKKYIDSSIVIVNASCSSRDEIAGVISLVRAKGARVIGLDYNFVKNDTASHKLDSVFHHANNVVIGYDYTAKKAKEGIPGSALNRYDNSTGFINLSDSASTIRQVEFFKGPPAGRLYSFALAVVEKSKFEYPLVGNWEALGKPFRIKYLSPDQFITRGLQEIPHDSDLEKLVQGRIVLIGDSDKRGSGCGVEDKHFTPLNPELSGRSYPDMDGIYVHANIIHSLLDKYGNADFIEISDVWANLLSALLCIPLIVLLMVVYCRPHHIYHFFTVLLYEPFVFFFFSIITVYLYSKSIVIPFGTVYIMLTLSPFLIYIFDLLDMWINRLLMKFLGTGTSSYFSARRVDHFLLSKNKKRHV